MAKTVNEEFKKMLTEILGVNPYDVDIEIVDGNNLQEDFRRAFEKATECAKQRGENIRGKMSNMSDSMQETALRRQLLASGLDNERIEEIIKEGKENKKRLQEEKLQNQKANEEARNKIVVRTMKAIADAYGYNLESAFIKNGVPKAVIKSKMLHTGAITEPIAEPIVKFDASNGFMVCSNIPENAMLMPKTAHVNAMRMIDVANMCAVLNQIDVQTWPEI